MMNIKKGLRLLLSLASVVVFLTACPEEDVTVEFHEAVVIGSGYGGSVSALRLGEAGIKTVVLEKGRAWDVVDPTTNSTFPTLESVLGNFLVGDSRSAWLRNICDGNVYISQLPFNIFCKKNTGLLDWQTTEVNKYDLAPKFTTNGINIITAAGVGGGSLSNNGIVIRPLREGWDLAYDLNELPHMEQIWEELNAEYFTKAENILGASLLPADIMASEYYEAVRINLATMIAAGYPLIDSEGNNKLHGTEFLPVAIDWDIVREEIAGTKVPSIIKGEVWLGANSGAKFSLDRATNYIGLAKATGNVDIRPLHTVSAISYDKAQKLYKIDVTETTLSYKVVRKFVIYTPNLISSAGSTGTTRLMMAAKHQGGLPKLNEYVGTKWTNNGDIAGLRFIKEGFVHQGGPAGAKIADYSDPNAPVVIEQGSQRAPAFFALSPEFAPFLGAVPYVGIGIPSETGTFSWDEENQRVHLDYPVAAGQHIYDRFYAIMAELDPFGPHLPDTLEHSTGITFHPLGGMPIGQATDTSCQVKNYKGLYAVDGSLVPGSAALANPLLLITSLAERCMDKAHDKIVRDTIRFRRNRTIQAAIKLLKKNQ